MQPSLYDERSPRFDGHTFEVEHDQARLTTQLARIRELMLDGQWRTLREIGQATKDSEASISAQLRNLRKVKHGAHVIERRSSGDRKLGLYQYRLVN